MMKYRLIKGKKIFPIGIGTWGIGGFAQKDPSNPDKKQIEALIYALQKGLNYIEVSMWAAQGHCAYLVSEAIKKSGIKREDIFITFVGYPYNVDSLEELEESLDKFMSMIGSDYVDAFQSSTSTSSKFGEDETDKMITSLIKKGKCLYTTFTNGNIDIIKKYKTVFKKKFVAHEVCFNFEVRENMDFGIIPWHERNDLLTVTYQPLRRNRTAKRSWPLLVELSKKYKKTQNQIILNWIYTKGFLPLVKSENKSHIDENVRALEFKIDENDLKKLDKFRPPKWITPKIDWKRMGDGKIDGDGIYIDQLPNIFDEEYDKIKTN